MCNRLMAISPVVLIMRYRLSRNVQTVWNELCDLIKMTIKIQELL